MSFSLSVQNLARNRRQTSWKKIIELEKMNGVFEKPDAPYGFFNVEKLLQSAKVVVLLENHYMF